MMLILANQAKKGNFAGKLRRSLPMIENGHHNRCKHNKPIDRSPVASLLCLTQSDRKLRLS